MRPRSILLFAIFFFGLFALPSATHASVPFFGPIIPIEINLCPASWGMLIDVINNIISFSITIAIVFIAPIMLLYAGFLLVVNPVNASGKEHAKKLLLNTIVGIVIALASWLIIDAVMAAFYNGSVTGANGSALGTWSSLITSGGVSPCLMQSGSLSQLDPGTGYVGSIATNNSVTTVGTARASTGGTNAMCASGNTACSPSFLQSIGFSPAQANAMSCIAITESSGNPYTPDSSTGACGTFQILHGNWSSPAIHSGTCSAAVSCNDPYCNAQSAYILGRNRAASGGSIYGDWTCPGCNAKAQACINQYDPGH